MRHLVFSPSYKRQILSWKFLICGLAFGLVPSAIAAEEITVQPLYQFSIPLETMSKGAPQDTDLRLLTARDGRIEAAEVLRFDGARSARKIAKICKIECKPVCRVVDCGGGPGTLDFDGIEIVSIPANPETGEGNSWKVHIREMKVTKEYSLTITSDIPSGADAAPQFTVEKHMEAVK